MAKRMSFIPTHKLKAAIPELNLEAGLELRQINPFADGLDPSAPLMMLDRRDWHRGGEPWLFMAADVEELESWPLERLLMVEAIAKRYHPKEYPCHKPKK